MTLMNQVKFEIESYINYSETLTDLHSNVYNNNTIEIMKTLKYSILRKLEVLEEKQKRFEF